MKRYLWLGVVLAAMITACGGGNPPGGGSGGGGGGGENYVNPNKTTATLSAVNKQLYAIAQPLALAGIPVPILVAPLPASVTPLNDFGWDCGSVVITGNRSDADNDGIPVSATYNGRCSWNYSGPEGSSSGYWEYKDLRIQDPDDHDPHAGASATGQVIFGYSGNGETLTWTWNLQNHEIAKQGGAFRFTYEGSWSVSATGGTYSLSYDLSGSWNPDNSTDPWGNGTLNANGSFNGSGSSCSNWQLNVTITDAHFNEGRIDGGRANFSGHDCDGDTENIAIVWSPTEVCITAEGHTSCVPNE